LEYLDLSRSSTGSCKSFLSRIGGVSHSTAFDVGDLMMVRIQIAQFGKV
jgi:hypothetical protein